MRHKLFQLPLLRSATLLTSVNIATTAATLISGLYIARQLDTQQYGQYAYMANIFLLMILGLGFGLSSQISKDAAEHHQAPDARFREMLSGLMALRIGTALLAAGGGALLSSISGEVVYLYAGLNAALFMCVDFVVGMFSGLQRIKRVALLLLVQPIIFILLILALPIHDELTVYHLFLASQIVNGMIAFLLAMQLPSLRVMPRLSTIRYLPWSDMVAGHVYVIMLLQTAYGAYGITLLGAIKYYAAAGELSIALTVVRMLPLLFGPLITVLYYPRLCSLHKQGDHQGFQRAAYGVYQVSTIVAAGCAALFVVYSDTIINLLYTSRHADAIPLLQLIACMSLFGIIDQVLTWTFVASDQPAKALPPLLARMGLMLLTLPLALFVDPPLLPRLVALAYIGSSCVGWVIQVHASQIANLLRAICFTIGVLGAGLVVGLTVRFVIPRPNLPYSEEGSLVVAAVCYGLVSAHLLWQRWKVTRTLIGGRT